MTEQNRPPDEPTQAYRPYGQDDEPTRMSEAIPPQQPSASTGASPTSVSTERRGGIVAPLVTVALLSVLLGIGIGYLLFHESSEESPTTTTTTTTALMTSTTAQEPTSTTTRRATTTTTEAASTSTTVRSSTTSTTAHASTSTTSGSSRSTTTTTTD